MSSLELNTHFNSLSPNEIKPTIFDSRFFFWEIIFCKIYNYRMVDFDNSIFKKLCVVSAPSGAGKTSLIKKIILTVKCDINVTKKFNKFKLFLIFSLQKAN